MSLNLALSTALSGLLTSQRALDVISHNVANVNNPEYARKTLNQESRVLAGFGVGVQVASVTREVDEGILKDVRREGSTLNKLQNDDLYHTRVQDMFGQPGSNISVGHLLQDLANAFESLATDVDKSTQQWATVQSATDITFRLRDMTEQLQQLRVQADQDMEDAVSAANAELENIKALNDSLALNSATGVALDDLKDKRDAAMTRLSNYMDFTYYHRSDNTVSLFTKTGTVLLDGQAQTLAHTGLSDIEPHMVYGGGVVSGVTVGGLDITGEITSGKVKSLIDLRDTFLPNLQAQLDEMSKTIKEEINKVHNRGTSFPDGGIEFTGSRTFISSSTQTIEVTGGDTVIALFDSDGKQKNTTTLNTLMVADGLSAFGSSDDWTIDEVVSNLEGWLDGELGASNYVTVDSDGHMAITIPDSAGYTLAFRDQRSRVIDSSLRMGSGATALGIAGTLSLTDSNGTSGPVNVIAGDSLDAIAADINALGGYSAEVAQDGSAGYFLRVTNSNGRDVVVSGTAITALGLKPSGTEDASDVSVGFDANADTDVDETVSGFSNFFGLNDFFVTNSPNNIYDSKVVSTSFTTSGAKEIYFADATGAIGATQSIASGSSLSDIATQINDAYRNQETDRTSAFSAAGGTLTIAANGTAVATVAVAAGDNIATIAATINGTAAVTAAGITAVAATENGESWLRLFDAQGDELSLSGTAVGTTSNTLRFTEIQAVKATVINEGAGQRLRLVHATEEELTLSENLIAELSLEAAASGINTRIDVRADLKLAPQTMARNAVLFDTNTNQYHLSNGDSTVARQLAEIMDTKVSFAAAGAIGSGNFKITEYASTITSLTARQTEYMRSQLDYQTSLKQSLDFSASNISGVNLDEEVSNLMSFQQAYSASARIITTIDEMFDVLIGVIR